MAILESQSIMNDSIRPVPASELEARLAKFREKMEEAHPGWEMAAVNHKVAMYYFTGTMQEGALVITPDEAREIVKAWYTVAYEGGRHQRRLDMISDIENGR